MTYIQMLCSAYEEVKRFISEGWTIEQAREELFASYSEALEEEVMEELLDYMK